MSMLKNRQPFILAVLCLVLGGCVFSGGAFEKRLDLAEAIAAGAGMQELQVGTGPFILTTYYKITNKNAPLSVYIEGDGFAWASRTRLSANPTPKDAFALQLAALDNSPNVVYIARPCQYTPIVPGDNCVPKYWSGSRFSEEVVTSVNRAISHYAKQFNKPSINLVGYSGGAAVAALIAARRGDVSSLRTVAGNLDHVAVNKYHKVDYLDNSLNPVDISNKLKNLPQYHFVGVDDEIIPLSIVAKFAKKTNQGGNCAKVHSVNGATHYSGWKNLWPALLQRPVSCEGRKFSKTNK